MLVFDEAYFDYGAVDSTYPPFLKMLEQSHVPWMVLRTFSKAYGLAGLRVGYAVASDASLISLMDRVRGPFNVNRLAQVAAIAALEDVDYVRECIARTTAERCTRRGVSCAIWATGPRRPSRIFSSSTPAKTLPSWRNGCSLMA